MYALLLRLLQQNYKILDFFVKLIETKSAFCNLLLQMKIKQVFWQLEFRVDETLA